MGKLASPLLPGDKNWSNLTLYFKHQKEANNLKKTKWKLWRRMQEIVWLCLNSCKIWINWHNSRRDSCLAGALPNLSDQIFLSRYPGSTALAKRKKGGKYKLMTRTCNSLGTSQPCKASKLTLVGNFTYLSLGTRCSSSHFLYVSPRV